MKISTKKIHSGCNGQIVEQFSLEPIPRKDPVKFGGPPKKVQYILASLFNCEVCGQIFIPTEKNGIRPFQDQEGIKNAMLNYLPKKLNNSVNSEEVLVLSEPRKTLILKKEDTVYLEKDINNIYPILDLEDKPQHETYLIIEEGKMPAYFNPTEKWLEDWNILVEKVSEEAREIAKISHQKAKKFVAGKNIKGCEWSNIHGKLWGLSYGSPQIPFPEIPRNAVPCVRVTKITFDKKVNFIEFLIPKKFIGN